MAPATSLQLLHIAAVLVMVASPGGVLAEVLFPSDVIVSTFDVLRERKCLPENFDTSAITKAGPCAMKVKSKEVPSECASAPIMAQFYNCFAHSMEDFSIMFFFVWDKWFELSRVQQRMYSFTDDNAWKWELYYRMSDCKLRAPATLTEEQEAVQMYMCIKFSLFANCDRDLVDRDSLDAVGMVRRAQFLVHNVKLWVSVFGAADAWARCSQNMNLEGEGEDPAVRYANVLSATACLLEELFADAEGLLDLHKFFDQIGFEIPDSTLLSMQCGEFAFGNVHVAAETFIQCMINEGVLLTAARDANEAAEAMNGSCVISA